MREVTIEEMIADLDKCGWKRKSQTQWESPDGALWRGPFGAWKALTEHTRRILLDAVAEANLPKLPLVVPAESYQCRNPKRRNVPVELDKIADAVWNYRPKNKAKTLRAKKRRKAK